MVDRIWHAVCIKRMTVMENYFFAAHGLFLGGHLRFG
jgi:hypothetical protein